MAFSHFKQGWCEPINFDIVQCNDVDFVKIMIHESITTEYTTCHYAYC
jgi:hypothetical protein